MKDATILIINYNSADDCIELVKSIKNLTCKNYNVLIIDNKSPKKNQIKKLKQIKQKNIRLIQNKINSGITGGVNFALKYINTPYTLLLNPDIKIEKNALTELLNTMQSDQKSFCVGGAIYNYYTKKLYALGGKFNFTTGMAKPLKHFHTPRKLNYGEYVDACILLFKTNLFKKLKYDERFFMYVETEDIILRAMKQGHTIYSNPKAKCYHKVYGSSGGKKSPLVTYYIARNKFLFLKKHLSKTNYLKFLATNLLIITPLQLLNFIIKKQINLIPAFVKGTIEGIKNEDIIFM